MEQISFSDAEYSAKKKITRREKLLLEMEQIVPWAILLREIEPLYPIAGRGRRPYPCASMLRIHLMQHWFALEPLNKSSGGLDPATARRVTVQRAKTEQKT